MIALARSTLPGAVAGAIFAVLELARLRAGGLELEPARLWPVVVGYILFAAALAASTGLLAAAAARLIPERLAGPIATLPLAAVLFVFSATIVNGLWLGSRTSAPSLLADLALLVASLACAGAFARLAARPAGALLALATLLCAGVLWGLAPRERAPLPAPASASERPNIVFVLIDTLRADHLGIYGYDRATSPYLDELAAGGLVFDHAYSTSNWTRPAVASLFTSTMPSRHGAVVQHRAPSAESPLLAAELQRAGYRTGFFTAGVNVEASDGYGRGADYFYSAYRRDLFELTAVGRNWLYPLLRRWSESGTDGHEQVRPPDLVARALAWQRDQPRNRPVFLYLHFHGPHTPYAPPPPYDRAFGGQAVAERLTHPPRPWSGRDALSAEDRHQMIVQYDGEIRWHDDGLRELMRGLQDSGRLDNAILVVTSDHGEAFGEHDTWGHNAALFGEIVRVPLVLWSGDGRIGAGRSPVAVSLLDLAPTLLDLAGLEAPDSFDGGSVLPWIRGERVDDRHVFFENPVHEELGVRTADWVYFEGPASAGVERWLFRAEDTTQMESLAAFFPEVADTLSRLVADRRRADRERAAPGRAVELDERRLEELKDLGYLQ